jgi:hypothetical protein
MTQRFASSQEAQVYAEAVFNAQVGVRVSTSLIPNSRNFLFRMESDQGQEYVVKVYAQTSELIGNCEAVAYKRLKGNSFVRECLGIDRGTADAPAWAIMEYLPGTTLLDSIESLQANPERERSIAAEIVRFIRDCVSVSVQGYGDIDAQFYGQRSSWLEFLDHYLEHLDQSVRKVQDDSVRAQMQRGLECLQSFRFSAAEFLASRPSAFVPVDLNMANFLISEDDRLVALDLENFLAADPLLALGEWAGHTFGTSRYEAFMRAWGPLTAVEQACVRFYALLCNMDVLTYIINNRLAQADQARPWGNLHRFVDLVGQHIEWLEAHAKP